MRELQSELTELRVELVASKIRVAECEFEKEQVRGKVSRLTKQLSRLGGDNLEVATRSTQMEMRLAQALQEAATLRTENAALQQDVSGMIDLKLQLAEKLAAS